MKDRQSKGFLLSFLFNLFYRMGWLVLSVILLVLFFTLHTPLWLIFIPIGIWILHSLLITFIMMLGNKAGNIQREETVNKNPYSKKTEDFLKK